MKHWFAGGSAALLLAAGLIAAAPPAGAGCQYGALVLGGKCDGPVQPDGSWQRCMAVTQYVPSGFSSHLVPVKRCELMGPGRVPADPVFATPPTHIPG